MNRPVASPLASRRPPSVTIESIEALCLGAGALQDSDPRASMAAADEALARLATSSELESARGLWSTALRYAGVSRVILGLLEEALPLLFRGISAARLAGCAADEAACLNAVGQALNRSGEYEGALTYLFEYLEKALQSGNAQDTCRALINIGNVYVELQDYPAALRKYRQAQGAWPGDAFSRAILHNNIGGVLLKQGAWHEAASSLAQALEHLRDAGPRPLLEAGILCHLGTVHGKLGRGEEARASLTRALTSARSAGGFRQEVGALTELGRLALAAGDTAAAVQTLSEALDISVKTGLRSCEGETCELISAALEAQGKFDLALVHERRSAAIALELHQGRSERRARALQIVLELNWPAGSETAAAPMGALQTPAGGEDASTLVMPPPGLPRAPQVPSENSASLAMLTPREREIVSYLWQGLSNKAIAQALSLSGYTVRHHVSTILRKLGAKSRAHVVAKTLEGNSK